MTAPIDPNLPVNYPKSSRTVYLEANRPPFKVSQGETNLTSSDVKYRDGSYYENNTEWKDLSNPGIPNIWKLARIVSKTQSQWFLIGGANGALVKIGVDAATLPGVNPVTTDGMGQINVTGAQVAAGVIGANVIRTHTVALAQFNIEIQQSGSSSAKNTDLNGASHFDDNFFDVDEGFVSAKGTGLVSTVTPDEDFDGSAATPISPQVGNVNFFSSIPGIIPVTRTLNSNGLPTGNLLVENRTWQTALVVDQSTTPGARGTFSTIQAAITAAVAGQDVFIRSSPIPYTENISLKPGVNLVGLANDEHNSNVTIVGKLTLSTAGTVGIANIRLQTNADNFLQITGSVASRVILSDCFLVASNAHGIANSSSSSSSAVECYSCITSASSTFKVFDDTSSGDLLFFEGRLGGSSTASTKTAGRLSISHCAVFFPITTSGTAELGLSFSNLDTSNSNVTAATCGGSVIHNFYNSRIASGTAAAISISNTTDVFNCIIDSDNSTSAITGAGTVIYGGLIFEGTTSNINVTNQTLIFEGPSRKIGSSNSGNTNTLTVTNTSNTASSGANILSQVAGGTAADATYQSQVSGVTTWTWGLDNSDSDAWVLAQGTALGTNNVMRVSTAGEINSPLQPAFLAYLPTTVNNVTGAGTAYTIGSTSALTEVFDQNNDFNTNGTFTAPVTGRYQLNFNTRIVGATAATTILLTINTSNRNYNFQTVRAASAGDLGGTISQLCDMDAADTATFVITVTGEAGDTDDISGGANVNTGVSGFLVA